MAERTDISFGHGNRGLQVGQNSGPITAAFHLPPERPETPPRPSFHVPFRRDPDFVERKTILSRIYEASLRPASRVALVGLGGAGKSQLAIEHAYRFKEASTRDKKEVWVFWVYAETYARVEKSFKSIADVAKIPRRNQPKADIPQLVYEWLQDERTGPWLIVLDSADNSDVFYDADERGRQGDAERRPFSAYLPQSPNGSIVITTRNKNLAFRLVGRYSDIVDVGPMDRDHALELLSRKSKELGDVEPAAELVEALEHIPLAISQAAAYIQRVGPRMSIPKYLEEFRNGQAHSSLLKHESGEFFRRDPNASNSVIKTWQISFEYIRLRRPSAAELLSLMSFFNRQGILESLVRPIHVDDTDEAPETSKSKSRSFLKWKGRLESLVRHLKRNGSSKAAQGSENTGNIESAHEIFEEDVKVLQDYCLVNVSTEGNIFEMHGLVQLATRKWLESKRESEKFQAQYISRMAQAFPTGRFENWETCRSLFPHVEKATELRPKDEATQKEWALVLYNSSWYACEQGRYTTSETMASMSRDARKTVLGPDHPDTLTSMANLASTYWNQGRWKEAESLNVQVMETRRTVLGPDHPDTLTSMANLASTYWNQGRLKEAESLDVQVMETRRTVLGPDHPDTLSSMVNLASTYWNQGRWKEAESLNVQVIETSKTVLGPDHPSTLTGMASLASTYWTQGRWKEAELLDVQVMETRRTVLGPDHPSTLNSMANLAFTWQSQNRAADALQLMDDCSQARIRVLGPEHPDTVSSLSTLNDWRLKSLVL